MVQSILPKMCTPLYKTFNGNFFNSPLSQELLNSVRRAKFELRRITGSEPKKLMDVAEYRSFPVWQEQWMRTNSWKAIIHMKLEQYLIYMPTNVLNQLAVFWLISGYCVLREQVVTVKILGDIWCSVLVASEICTLIIQWFFLLVHFERSAVFCVLCSLFLWL